MKVYVLLWYDGPGWDVEGVTTDKELAVKWNQDDKYNEFVEHELIETEAAYNKWFVE